MDAYLQKGDTLCGDFMAKVMANALKMGCNNACMKRIVAAPTAGACGVLPAVLVIYYREYDVPDEKMIEAMYVAAGIGQIIANRAYLMPGRDRFRLRHGGRSDLLYQRRRHRPDRRRLRNGA